MKTKYKRRELRDKEKKIWKSKRKERKQGALMKVGTGSELGGGE